MILTFDTQGGKYMDTTIKYMWYGLGFFAVIVIDMIIPHFIIVTLAALALGGLTGAFKSSNGE